MDSVLEDQLQVSLLKVDAALRAIGDGTQASLLRTARREVPAEDNDCGIPKTSFVKIQRDISFDQSTRFFNSFGSMENGLSGPGHCLDFVKCFSTILAPTATDPNATDMPKE